VKPARDVVVGDRLEITKAQERWTVMVAGLADRRGPASAAQALYEETPESAAERQKRRDERRLARPIGADLSERPTKRDRRRLDALRRGQKRR
jgi:ribosome-associated heat shock protein Hsp15